MAMADLKRIIAPTIILSIALFAMASNALGSARQALVIGNSDYRDGFALSTPLADSSSIAAKLAEIGYEVHGGGARLDLELDEFNNELDSFLNSISNGDTTFIFYAGHGAASAGANYLVPILPPGVRLRSESDIRDRSISLHGIMERIERRNPNGVNIFFFDACRDAPVDNFSRTINMSGLTRIDTGRQPRGSFIGFSTEYGKIALDGDPSGNSPFTEAVLDSLEEQAAVPIELFYKSVTEKVYQRTDGQQFPIQESKMRGKHCIIECFDSPPTASVQEYGTLNVLTKPEVSEVCYRIDSWKSWNCGAQMVLPINENVEVRVAAKGYKTSVRTTRLNRDVQQLSLIHI